MCKVFVVDNLYCYRLYISIFETISLVLLLNQSLWRLAQVEDSRALNVRWCSAQSGNYDENCYTGSALLAVLSSSGCFLLQNSEITKLLLE